MKFIVVDSIPGEDLERAWRDCLENSDEATHYTAPEFFLEPSFNNGTAFAVLATHDGRVDGVLTGTSGSGAAECGLASRPQLCRRRGASIELVGAVLADGLKSLPRAGNEVLTAFFWERLPAFEDRGFKLRVYSDEIVMLNLALGPKALFSQCSDTRRNKIRRAKRSGVSVSVMNLDSDFEDYYSLYQEWCSFKKLKASSHEVQRVALGSANRLVLVARHEGHLVGASIFRFVKGGIMEYAANVSRREESRIRQNDLLMWTGIEWGCSQGFKRLSLGGAHFYLRSFGGELVPTYRYRFDRTRFRSVDAKDSIRETLSRFFRRLPIPIQEIVRPRRREE